MGSAHVHSLTADTLGLWPQAGLERWSGGCEFLVRPGAVPSDSGLWAANLEAAWSLHCGGTFSGATYWGPQSAVAAA